MGKSILLLNYKVPHTLTSNISNTCAIVTLLLSRVSYPKPPDWGMRSKMGVLIYLSATVIIMRLIQTHILHTWWLTAEAPRRPNPGNAIGFQYVSPISESYIKYQSEYEKDNFSTYNRVDDQIIITDNTINVWERMVRLLAAPLRVSDF